MRFFLRLIFWLFCFNEGMRARKLGKTEDTIHIYLFFRVFPQKMARKMGFIAKTTPDVKRRDNLRTDRRIVLRTEAYRFPWIKLRSRFRWLLKASFFEGKLHFCNLGTKTGIFTVIKLWKRTSIGVLKMLLIWHPSLLRISNMKRGGMDATIEAFAFG